MGKAGVGWISSKARGGNHSREQSNELGCLRQSSDGLIFHLG